MKARCYNENYPHYSRYGARGIKMCEAWRKVPAVFYEWALQNGYQSDLSIDRIDNDGNYEPGNCRWADLKTQANNTRRNIVIKWRGEVRTLAEWVEHLGLDYHKVNKRLQRGWTIKRAFTEPNKMEAPNKKRK